MATVAHVQSNFNGRWNAATWFAGDFAGRKTVAYSSLSPRSFMGEPLSLIEGAHIGDGDSSVVRAQDSRLKGPGFKSL